MTTKTKTADNGTQQQATKQDDLNQNYIDWLKENNAQPVIVLRSPSGAVVPLSDLFQLPRGWLLQVGVVGRDDGDGS